MFINYLGLGKMRIERVSYSIPYLRAAIATDTFDLTKAAPKLADDSYQRWFTNQSNFFRTLLADFNTTKSEIEGNSVEVLLAESTTLLDKVIEGWNRKNDLEVQAFELWLLHAKERTLYEIQSRIAKIEFEYPAVVARERFMAATESLTSLDAALAQKDALIDFTKPDSEHRSNRAYMCGWLGRVNSSEKATQTTVEQYYRDLEITRIDVDYASYLADLRSLEARIAETKREAAALEALKAYEEENRSAKEDRHKLSQATIDCREFFATRDGFGLNYKQRIAETIELLDADMHSLLVRLHAVRSGLREYFGIDVPPIELGAENLLAKLSGWLRGVIDSFLRVTASEVEYTVTLSIRDLLGDETWDQQRKSGYFRLECRQQSFGNVPFPRIRAIGAALRAETEREPGLYQADLRLSSGQFVRIGNIRVRQIGSPPAISMGLGLINRSPIGQMELILLNSMGDRKAAEGITDLEIDLRIAGIPSTESVHARN